MTNADRFDRLRGLLHTGEIPHATPDCLDAESVGALAEGTLVGNARAHALAHLATCALCRRAVASVAGALADDALRREVELVDGRAGRWWRSRTFRIAAPLAAAATVVALLSPTSDSDSPQHRAGAPAAGPTLIGPRGTVASASRLHWRGIPGADRYRVTVFTARGGVLYDTEVTDTVAPLPDSVRFISGQPYLWRVEARTGWGRWIASDLVDFTLARAPPR